MAINAIIESAVNRSEHRLTKPRTPQTNGMIERFNGRIAEMSIILRDLTVTPKEFLTERGILIGNAIKKR